LLLEARHEKPDQFFDSDSATAPAHKGGRDSAISRLEEANTSAPTQQRGAPAPQSRVLDNITPTERKMMERMTPSQLLDFHNRKKAGL
jgi:hypothetical protein